MKFTLVFSLAIALIGILLGGCRAPEKQVYFELHSRGGEGDNHVDRAASGMGGRSGAGSEADDKDDIRIGPNSMKTQCGRAMSPDAGPNNVEVELTLESPCSSLDKNISLVLGAFILETHVLTKHKLVAYVPPGVPPGVYPMTLTDGFYVLTIMDSYTVYEPLSPPLETTEAQVYVNLSSMETAVTGGFDICNAENTTNFSVRFAVYDSLGIGHIIIVYFTLISMDPVHGSVWEYNVVAEGQDWSGGTPGDLYVGATGLLAFDNQGRLNSESQSLSSFNFSGGAAQNQQIEFDFGDSIAEGGTGIAGSTQFGNGYLVIYIGQNGHPV